VFGYAWIALLHLLGELTRLLFAFGVCTTGSRARCLLLGRGYLCRNNRRVEVSMLLNGMCCCTPVWLFIPVALQAE
jgi:hypothetical protein